MCGYSVTENEHGKVKVSVLKGEKDNKDNSQIKKQWIMDSGASRHICNNVEYFDTLSNEENIGKVIVRN